MPNSAFTENRTEAARALVEHLRRNPEEARSDPAALAARFDLPTEFVRRALARLPSEDRSIVDRTPSRIMESADGLVAVLDQALDRAAANPLRFEALSLLLAIFIAMALNWIIPAKTTDAMTVRGVVTLVVMIATVALQMGVFYRRRMVRFALYGGLMFGVGTALPMMVNIWIKFQSGTVSANSTELKQGVLVFVVGLAMMLLGVVYAGLASLASIAGGWVQLKKADQEWERLSRQELLERYFELQRRLERSVAAPDAPQSWETWPVVIAIRRHPLVSAAILGLVSGLLEIVLGVSFSVLPAGGASNDAFDLIDMVGALVAYSVFTVVAFLAGRATRGALAGGMFVLGALLATLLPAFGYGPAYTFSSDHLLSQVLVLAFLVFVGALSGVGATVQRRAARDGRLQKNDGATIVAEMLEIQWRLEEDATSVTVLVIDAAKSTAMKVGADPLDVEYSFREYQMWLAECCAGFGGRIHSVAGDGAVVAFSDGLSAIGAARRIQTDVTRFNAALNRLPKPFRLRLGLHAGRVAGDLNDVQFTEVIDIAAHVEDIAPVGGIAATEAVIAHLGHDGFLPLAREIDGQAVYIALVPTES